MLNDCVRKSIMCVLMLLVFAILCGPTHALVGSLTWDVNPDADGYEVYCRVSTDDAWEVVDVKTTQGDNQTIFDNIMFQGEKLQPGINYMFTVKAFNTCGNSSDYADAITYFVGIPDTMRVALTGTKLSWSYPVISDVVGYRISYTYGQTTQYVDISNQNTFTFDVCAITAQANTPYTFSVSALNQDGVYGADSNTVTYTRRLPRQTIGLKVGKSVIR